MTLQKGHLTVSFANGLNEKDTPQLQADGFQAIVQNGQFVKNDSIRKRNGIKVLGTTPASAPFRLNTFQNELTAACADNQLRGFSPNATVAGNNWIPRNFMPEAVASRIGVTSEVGAILEYDIAVSGNTACVVWCGTSTGGVAHIFGALFDVGTGAAITGVAQIDAAGAAIHPKVIASSGLFCVMWISGNNLAVSNISATAPGAWAAPAVLFANLTTAINTGVFDFVPVVGKANAGFAFFENNTGIGLPMTVFEVNTSTLTTVNVTTTANADTGYTAISVSATNGDPTFYCAYTVVAGGNTLTKAFTIDATTHVLTLPVALQMTNVGYIGLTSRLGIVRTITNKNIDVVVSPLRGGGAATTPVVSYCSSLNLAPSGQIDTRRLVLLGRPVRMANGRTYITAFFNHSGDVIATPVLSLQCTTWLLDITNKLGTTIRPVCTIAPTATTAQAHLDRPSICSIVPTTSANTWLTLTDANEINTHSIIELVTLDYVSDHLQLGAEIGHQLSLTGGVPTYYDGNDVNEIGFFNFPEGVTLTLGGGGSGFLNAQGFNPASYSYQVVYEWYDAQGQYHQSQPSVPVSIAMNGIVNESVNVSIPSLNMTARSHSGAIGLAIYRTAVNGTILTRVQTEDLPPGSFNTTNTDFQVILDTASDASIATHRPIWNTGGNVARVCPPSSSVAIVHKDRLWLAAGDDPRNVWFSGTLSDGDGPWFSLAFIQRFPEPIVALASMDGRLVAFSRYSIFVVDGDGPSDTGQGSELTAPSRVNSPSGCIDARSVVRFSDGILFQSEGGIYQLTRSLEVSYYGSAIEDTLASNPTVTSAVILEEQGQQRFTLSGGTIATFDDVQKAWSTAVYSDAIGQLNPTGATKWGANGYVFCSGGIVYQEDAVNHLDAGRWVPQKIVSNWFKPQPMQGFGRFWMVTALLQGATDHDLTISIAYNYDPTIVDTHTWQILKNGPLSPGGNESLAIKPSRQKCEAIQVTIQDATPTAGGAVVGTGAGFYAIALDFEVGQKTGNYKLPAIARF